MARQHHITTKEKEDIMYSNILTRAACRPLSDPPAPRGHYSHTAQPHSLVTLATLAHDPLQPRHVRRWHRAALETSLQQLASLVRSVTA